MSRLAIIAYVLLGILVLLTWVLAASPLPFIETSCLQKGRVQERLNAITGEIENHVISVDVSCRIKVGKIIIFDEPLGTAPNYHEAGNMVDAFINKRAKEIVAKWRSSRK